MSRTKYMEDLVLQERKIIEQLKFRASKYPRKAISLRGIDQLT